MIRNDRSVAGRGWPVALFILLLAGCGGGAGGDEGSSSSSSAATDAAASVPMEEPTGPVDPALAERGEELFRTRGCTACHTVGEGRKVGPDLEGIAGRRDFAWIYHMVMSPDSMVRNDSTARALLDEYLVPMADQNIQPEQFRAIFEYLRQETSE